MVDAAWQGTDLAAQDVAERARVLNRLRIGDIVFHQLTKSSAILVLVVLGGVILSLFLGALPALQEFGFGFLTTTSWNPVTEKFGALAPIYGTIITSLHRHADRGAVRADDRDVSDRALPDVAASPDRHRDRTPRGHSQHYLRNLGPVRIRAFRAATRAAAGDRCLRKYTRPLDAVRRAALRHWYSDRRASSWRSWCCRLLPRSRETCSTPFRRS